MRRTAFFLIGAIVVACLLPSCDFFGDGDITISGTITLDSSVTQPSGTPQIIVGLISYVPSVGDATTTLSMTWASSFPNNPQYKPYGTQNSYSFTSVPTGSYLVVAWVDLNGNGSWEPAEASGSFPSSGSSAMSLYNFQDDHQSANITLYPYGGGGTVTIAGSISAGSGVTQAAGYDLVVGLLDAVPGEDGTTVTWASGIAGNPTTLTTTASGPISYSFPDVPSGSYMVMAWVDANSDDAWDQTEPWGSFPEWGESGSLYALTSDKTDADIVLIGNPLSVPATPVPSDNATGVDAMAATLLDWADCTTTAGLTVTYDVYIAANELPATKTNTASLTASEWSLQAAFLTTDTTYKWKVVAHDSAGNTTEGPTWTFATGTPSSPGVLANGLFTDTGWSDWEGGYSMPSEWSAYGNVSDTGDYVPGWTLYVDDGYLTQGPVIFSLIPESASGFDTGAEDNYMYLASDLDLSNSNGYAAYIYQEDTGYTVTATSTLKIRFKIVMYVGGDAVYQYYEAPVKVSVKVEEAWYLIAAYTPETAGGLAESVSAGEWLNREIMLDGISDSEEAVYISAGTVIDGVKVWANGWSWEVLIDTVQIEE